jgi:hypothetical protein
VTFLFVCSTVCSPLHAILVLLDEQTACDKAANFFALPVSIIYIIIL